MTPAPIRSEHIEHLGARRCDNLEIPPEPQVLEILNVSETPFGGVGDGGEMVVDGRGRSVGVIVGGNSRERCRADQPVEENWRVDQMAARHVIVLQWPSRIVEWTASGLQLGDFLLLREEAGPFCQGCGSAAFQSLNIVSVPY